jgi:hypothetical protein
MATDTIKKILKKYLRALYLQANVRHRYIIIIDAIFFIAKIDENLAADLIIENTVSCLGSKLDSGIRM